MNPYPVPQASYDAAQNASTLRGYKWNFVGAAPGTNFSHVYIQAAQVPPYVTGGPQDYLWQQQPDYCHVTLQFAGNTYNLRNAHLTIGPGQFLPDNKMYVRRVVPGNPPTYAPSTRATLVADTINALKLEARVRADLQGGMTPARRQTFQAAVASLGSDNVTVIWVPGAQQVLMTACQAILNELSTILGDFGLALGAQIPNV